MVAVKSISVAVELLNEVIINADFVLGADPEDQNAVAITATKSIVSATESYRDYVISQRNRAIQALSDLNIDNVHTTGTPDIGPKAS